MKIVVTGTGILSSQGSTNQQFLGALMGARTPPTFASACPDHEILVHELLDPDLLKGLPKIRPALADRSAMIAVATAMRAIEDAELDLPAYDATRIGVVMGNGSGSAVTIEQAYRDDQDRSRRPSPLNVAKSMPSCTSSWISMAFGLQGPSIVVAGACASATQAIGLAAQILRSGMVDIVLAGGTDAPLTNLLLRSWQSMNVLTSDACRPFSKDRSGIILAEGGGVVILETEEGARKRGANCEISLVGFGLSSDAKDLTAPNPSGMARAMTMALQAGNLSAADITYINAHGTGTALNDRAETQALKMVFGDNVPPVSSTKSIHGHGLGASGAFEAVATILAMRNGNAPPTVNFNEADPECAIDCIPNEPRSMNIDYAMSNSFAFGGMNSTIIFGNGV